MLTDFFPARMGSGIIDVHKTRVQISRKRVAFIEDEGHAIVAMTRCMKDFSMQANIREELSAVFQFQNEIVVLCNGKVGKVLPFEKLGKRRYETDLMFQDDQFYALIF